MDNKKPLISVVVPCYNHGQYVDEAVDSVLNQTYQNFEIIIVNDGSTDEETNKILANYNKPKTRVLTTSNQGLPSARNNGIKEANGEFILPLDADDKIHPEYLERTLKIIQENENIGIVYGKTEFFGDKTGVWDLPEFTLKEMLLRNLIVCTSLLRRSDWEKVGGFNKNMIYGFEDHDFWLSILELGREVRFIPEVMFYYRKVESAKGRAHSVADITGSQEKILYSFRTLAKNHPKIYSENLEFIMETLKSFEIQKDTLELTVLQRDNAIKDLHLINYNLKKELQEERAIPLKERIKKRILKS